MLESNVIYKVNAKDIKLATSTIYSYRFDRLFCFWSVLQGSDGNRETILTFCTIAKKKGEVNKKDKRKHSFLNELKNLPASMT